MTFSRMLLPSPAASGRAPCAPSVWNSQLALRVRRRRPRLAAHDLFKVEECVVSAFVGFGTVDRLIAFLHETCRAPVGDRHVSRAPFHGVRGSPPIEAKLPPTPLISFVRACARTNEQDAPPENPANDSMNGVPEDSSRVRSVSTDVCTSSATDSTRPALDSRGLDSESFAHHANAFGTRTARPGCPRTEWSRCTRLRQSRTPTAEYPSFDFAFSGREGWMLARLSSRMTKKP